MTRLILLVALLLPLASSYSYSGSCTDSHECLHKWHADVFKTDPLTESSSLKAFSKDKLSKWDSWPFPGREMYAFSKKKQAECSTGYGRRVGFHYTGENLNSGTAAFTSFCIRYFTTLDNQRFFKRIKGEFGCDFSLKKKIIFCTYCQ